MCGDNDCDKSVTKSHNNIKKKMYFRPKFVGLYQFYGVLVVLLLFVLLTSSVKCDTINSNHNNNNNITTTDVSGDSKVTADETAVTAEEVDGEEDGEDIDRVDDDEVVADEDIVQFCDENYVDAAYYNGYDTIVTRGDWLWYYYKDDHNLSAPFSQKDFTQGDHIQGAFNVSKVPKCKADEVTDCREILKMRGMAVYFLHNKARGRGYYNLDVRNRDGSQKRVKSKNLPWAMKQVGLLGGNLWPNGWETYQEHRPVAYLPSRYEMIFIINGRNFSNTVLAWNTLDTKNWNSSWRYKDIGHNVVYTGMFEMNGIVYAIGETKNSIDRVGKVYRYHVVGHNNRKLTQTHQMVNDFFGCPERSQRLPTLVNTIRTNREIRTGNVINKSSTNTKSTTDDDSILISIFIGIVITACLTTIILSFLTITGITYFYCCIKKLKQSRKKSKLEAMRAATGAEPTLPKTLPVIGLDYSPRQTSNVSRFDTLSSITAIYSQINKNQTKPKKSASSQTQLVALTNGTGNGTRPATRPASIAAIYAHPHTARVFSSGRHYHSNSMAASNASVNCISNGNHNHIEPYDDHWTQDNNSFKQYIVK